MSSSDINPDQLAGWVRDARARTLEIFDDLTDEQLRVPQLEILNPFLWEIGHIAWFQEHWVLRHAAGADPLLATGDALYDSSAVHHDTRWDLALPTREQTLDYVHAVRDRVLSRLGEAELGQPEAYFNQLSVFHEDMHDEAFLYMRQTLGYPMPRLTGCSVDPGRAATTDLADGDAEVPGGTLELGGLRDAPFVFDNERWAHAVEIEPFAIARTPVTQGQFAKFADDGGYQRRELWSDEGWRWRDGCRCRTPDPFCPRRQGLAAASLRPAASAGAQPAGGSRQRVRGRGLLPLGRPASTHRGGMGGGSGMRAVWRGRSPRVTQAPLPLGRPSPGSYGGQPRRPGRGHGRRRGAARGRQRIRLPPDVGQRLGMDEQRVRALPRL